MTDTDRDRLARLIDDTLISQGDPRVSPFPLADAILAAGYERLEIDDNVLNDCRAAMRRVGIPELQALYAVDEMLNARLLIRRRPTEDGTDD